MGALKKRLCFYFTAPNIVSDYSNSVTPLTAVAKDLTAFCVRERRRASSSSADRRGFPTGYGIATVGTILFAPTDFEIVVIVAM